MEMSVTERVNEFVERLSDADGDLLPIESIKFAPGDGEIHWTISSQGKALLELSCTPDELPKLMEASQLFLQIAAGERAFYHCEQCDHVHAGIYCNSCGSLARASIAERTDHGPCESN